MKIAFLGDIALIGKYDMTKNKNAKKRLKTIAKKLKDYDYVIGNLESPLTDTNKTLVCKSMHLRSPVINVEILKYLNIDAVSLANNHLFDFGKSGLKDSIETLEKNNIEWFGGNKKSMIKDIKGEKISFSGFACYSTNGSGYRRNSSQVGINPLTYESISEQLERDELNNAYSVMSFHWGDEHTNYPKIEHIELAKKIVKIKDVIIYGHHPHVIQGIQHFNNSLVAYSLGNFIFDDCISLNGKFVLRQNEQNKKSFIMEVELNNGMITNTSQIGIRETVESIEFFDIDDEIKNISRKIDNISKVEEYENLRYSQISKVRLEKFGKRDLNWLISRLNYYSIGARIMSDIRKRKYLRISSKF